jgi:hypothetical protein
MGLADANTLVSPALTAAVLAVAALLAWRQLAERRGRAQGMTAADRRHFARQDVRRLTGSGVMALIGLGIAWGAGIDPRGDGWSKRLFLSVWLVVILLVFFLVMLALLDLLSTRLYAPAPRPDPDRPSAARPSGPSPGAARPPRPGATDGTARSAARPPRERRGRAPPLGRRRAPGVPDEDPRELLVDTMLEVASIHGDDPGWNRSRGPGPGGASRPV